MPEDTNALAGDVEITVENLRTLPAIGVLGDFASRMLEKYGKVTFVVGPKGNVIFANTAHVHIHPQAVADPGKCGWQLKRPVFGDGRPDFVVWHDEALWEVELLDEEKPEDPSG